MSRLVRSRIQLCGPRGQQFTISRSVGVVYCQLFSAQGKLYRCNNDLALCPFKSLLCYRYLVSTSVLQGALFKGPAPYCNSHAVCARLFNRRNLCGLFVPLHQLARGSVRCLAMFVVWTWVNAKLCVTNSCCDGSCAISVAKPSFPPPLFFMKNMTARITPLSVTLFCFPSAM